MKFETKTEAVEQSQSNRNARSQTETRCSIHEAINSRRRDLPHIRIPFTETPFPHPIHDSFTSRADSHLWVFNHQQQQNNANESEMPGVALTSTAGGGEASPSAGVVEPRKQEELGSRLLARRPLTLPFPLLTSPPASDAATAEDDGEDEEDAALLLPDPITHHSLHPPHRTLQIHGSARSARHCPDSTPHSPETAPGCGWPRARRLGGRETGTSATVASASLLPPLQTLA